MVLELLIDSVDRIGDVDIESIRKTDQINERTDTLNFTVKKVAGVSFTPTVGDDVVFNMDGTRIFGGIVIRVQETTQGEKTIVYDVECVDYTFTLNRKLVTNRYKDKTVQFIIEDIITTYVPDFTFANVDANVTISSIGFNRLTVGQCLQKLADMLAYFWYVDYNKDVHFFAKNTELAAFGLTDTGGNHLYDSLNITKDLSQIRNRVFIKGGLAEGSQRTEDYLTNGVQLVFPLGNKFSSRPSVTLNSIPFSVGIDFVDSESAYSVMFNFDQTYIRFIDAPATGMLAVTGIPLFPLVVNVTDTSSIAEFGEYEFAKEDSSVRTRDEAINLALAELEAYANEVTEGGFKTYEDGLRSGQVINVNSVLRGMNEDFLIQSVRFSMLSKDRAIYNVSFASLKTIGIIAVLQKLLLDKKLQDDGTDEQLISLVQFADAFNFTDTISVPFTVSEAPYLWVDEGTGIGLANPLKWNMGTWWDYT